jgi:hypothetical protein
LVKKFFTYEEHKISFPLERINKEFVGDVFDHDENRHPEYWKLIN